MPVDQGTVFYVSIRVQCFERFAGRRPPGIAAFAALTAGMLFFAAPARGQTVFVERFDSSRMPERWKMDSDMDPPGLRWYGPGEKPGFHFRAEATRPYIKTHDYAWANWNVGTNAFEFSWTVLMNRGLRQKWFYPGSAVALSSGKPGEMKEGDIAVGIGLHMGGMTAAVRRGGFYDLVTEGRGAYANFKDSVVSGGLIDRSGGNIASADWPAKYLDKGRIEFRIRRDEENTITFSILWPDLPGNRGTPYWTGSWTMTEEIAKMPLRYVVVKRVPVEKVHVNYPGFIMQGVVQNIQGRLSRAQLSPVVTGFSRGEPVLRKGVEILLHGANFREGLQVKIGPEKASSVSVNSPEEVTCRLPDLPGGKRYAVSVTGPEGLTADLKDSLPYGRMIERVEPREVLPGGGIAALAGAGFEKTSVFSFGGNEAEIIEVESPERVRVKVPPGETGRAGVSARTGTATFTGKPLFGYAPHPYLFFHAEDIPGIRGKFNAEMFRHYRRRVLDQAEAVMKKEPKGGLQASTMALAYAFTGKEEYRERAVEEIRKGKLKVEYSDFNMMGVSGMAIAYDVLFRELAPADRAGLQEYLQRMVEGYLRDARGSWFLGGHFNFSNTVPVGNCGGMLAGLALMHSTPAAERAVEAAAGKARVYPDQCISPDGGCREGVQYWDYGCSFHLILAHALQHATGDDRGLLDHPHLERNVNFIRTQLGGHGGLFAFCDTREPWLDGFAICADLGSRYRQPLMLWVADLAARGGEKTRARDSWAAFAFLWRSREPAPDRFPGVPTLAWLKDMHWGAMRSDGSFSPKLVVGTKGSQGRLTHHKQNDPGSFVLHANGEAYLVDPGYYEGKATDHTLPLIDGKEPGVSGSSIFEAWENGPWRTMTLESTEAYGKIAERVRRIIVMHGEDSVTVLDDVAPVGTSPGDVTAQYQTGWKPHLDESAPGVMTLTGLNGKIVLRCFGPAIKLGARDREFRSGWHWKKISKDGPGNWHTVSGTYPADTSRPLVTVIQPAAEDEPFPEPPKCFYGNEQLEVKFPGGTAVRFMQKHDGWQFIRP
ncbi:MAG: IPT/TIG domain-containing protein [Kiritimatiellia bacterium]